MVYCWVSRDITQLHLRHLEKKTEALRLELRGRGDFPLPQDFWRIVPGSRWLKAVVRCVFSPPARWGLLDLITVVLLLRLRLLILHLLLLLLPLLQLLLHHLCIHFHVHFRLANSSPTSACSGHCWTSTWDLPSSVSTAGPQPGTFRAQWAPLDPNGQIECQKMPEDMPDRTPDSMSDRMPKDMPDRTPDRMSDRMPEDMPDKMPDDMPDRMPQGMPDKVPECLPDRMPEDLPDRMPNRMSEDMPEDMPDRMPQDMPKHMPEDMPGRMPEDMPDRMPDRMPEDMSDRMPEDLPVTKRIYKCHGGDHSKESNSSFSYWFSGKTWKNIFLFWRRIRMSKNLGNRRKWHGLHSRHPWISTGHHGIMLNTSKLEMDWRSVVQILPSSSISHMLHVL